MTSKYFEEVKAAVGLIESLDRDIALAKERAHINLPYLQVLRWDAVKVLEQQARYFRAEVELYD